MDSEVAPKPLLLLIDDDPETLQVIREMLEPTDYRISAHSEADSARTWLEEHPGQADIIISDLRMPNCNGLELLQEFRRKDPTIAGILLTGFGNMENAVDAMRVGAVDFITKPFEYRVLELALARAMQHRKVLLDNQRYQADLARMAEERGAALAKATEHLEDSYQFMLESFVTLLEARERSTGEHTKRVTSISVAIAETMGLDAETIEVVRRGASLHDIGKVGIPDAILLKPGPLNPQEWKVMQTHVELGYNIIKTNPYLKDVAELVYSHHEHFDGGGYPRGLKGEEICIGARIFSVADSYDAIRSKRPYSLPRSAEFTLREIERCQGTQFDPVVVEALGKCHDRVEALWVQGATLNDFEPDYAAKLSGGGGAR